MKRTIAILLVLCTLLCMLAACKDEKKTPTDTESDTGMEFPDDGLPNVDMKGYELGILTYDNDWFNWAEPTMAPEGSYSGNILYEEMFERNAYVEERFKCLLNISTETNIDKTYIQNLSLAGDSSEVDIVMYYDKWVLGSAVYFADWNEVEYVDLSQDYWNPGVTQMFKINGVQIAASGSFSLGMLSRTEVMLFNKDMYTNRFGDVSSMYGLVEDNAWTLEKLYELAEQVVFSEDDTWNEADTYGISASKKELYTSLIIGSGVRFVQKNEDGVPKFTLSADAAAKDKLLKLLQLNQDNQIHYDVSSNAHYPSPELFFEKGKTLFAVRTLFDIPTARATLDAEFGIVPIPKYNSDQQEYYSACFGGDVACLMNTVKDEDKEYLGIIMEALAYDSQENLIPLYKEDLLKTRYSDEDSSEMLDIVFDSTYSDMGVNVLEDTVSMYLIKNVFATKTDVIASELLMMELFIPDTITTMIKDIK